MTVPPRWLRVVLRLLLSPDRVDDALGDLDEVHRQRLLRHGPLVAYALTLLEALEMVGALLVARVRVRPEAGGGRGPLVSRLDFKLGLRMLARYPGLTLMGGLAMAFGIAIGAGTFELAREIVLPHVPYEDGERIVGIQEIDPITARPDPHVARAFLVWRQALRSIGELSALAVDARNLAVPGEGTAPVFAAAVSATAFDLIPSPPLLGRPLLAADEAAGAPPVAVLSYQLWQERFDGDPAVVGHVVRLGGEPTTVVGVMPEGLAFSVPPAFPNLPPPQDLWVPFRLDASEVERGRGPAFEVFGRLEPGATPERVRAEVTSLASGVGDTPTNPAGTGPRYEVLTFGHPSGVGDWPLASGLFALTAFFLAALMALLCGNVALLLFARAAAREGEIAVRNALGASRMRIVAQLFAEALALAGVASSWGSPAPPRGCTGRSGRSGPCWVGQGPTYLPGPPTLSRPRPWSTPSPSPWSAPWWPVPFRGSWSPAGARRRACRGWPAEGPARAPDGSGGSSSSPR